MGLLNIIMTGCWNKGGEAGNAFHMTIMKDEVGKLKRVVFIVIYEIWFS